MRRIPRIVLACAALLALAGCATMQKLVDSASDTFYNTFSNAPNLEPLGDPEAPLVYAGFSIRPPPGDNWFRVVPGQPQLPHYTAAFFKKVHKQTGTRDHTVIATVIAVPLPAEEAPAGLIDTLLAEKRAESDRGRYRRLSFESRRVSTPAPQCGRWDTRARDMGVPGHKDEPFVMMLSGLVCRHPNAPNYFLQAEFSQRVPPDGEPLNLDAERDAFLAGLTLSPLPYRFTKIDVGPFPQDVAFGHGSIWVADLSGNRVLRIEPETNAILATVPVGRGPIGLGIGPDSVWVVNGGEATVSRLSADTNAVEATVKVPPQQTFR